MQSRPLRRTLLFLLVFEIMVFALILSNNAFAQRIDPSLHNKTLYEVVKQTSGLDKNSQIEVGDFPITISINENTNTVYVANGASNSISVINGENNIWINDIPVEKRPESIFIADAFPSFDRVYVANSASNSISVINGENNTWIKDIPVGNQPGAIAPATSSGRPEKIYVANTYSNNISVISVETNKWLKNITVGRGPMDIAISLSPIGETVYIVNYMSKDISVINGETDTWIKDIPVRSAPTSISSGKDYVYVANTLNNSISVISAEKNNTWIKDIPVGEIKDVSQPMYRESIIAVNENTNTVYVANPLNNSISVISGEKNNTRMPDIPVGKRPGSIGINENTNTVYVANTGSNSISVIDGRVNKVVAGITFQVHPFNSGYIRCDGLTTPSPIEQYIYVYSGDECIAKPNEGFEFVSWDENIKDNSTQTINLSKSASSLESIANLFKFNKTDEPEAKLKITKFGSFTANFKELPPPLPSEYWIPLYGLIIGFFIPSIIKWLNGWGQRRNLTEYLYKIGKVDRHIIEDDVLKLYSNGKISDSHYQMLKDKISEYYEKSIDK